jgi:hypothetical protein
MFGLDLKSVLIGAVIGYFLGGMLIGSVQKMTGIGA